MQNMLGNNEDSQIVTETENSVQIDEEKSIQTEDSSNETTNIININGEEEKIPERIIYGELLYFLMTTSILRSLLLLLVIDKGAINIPEQSRLIEHDNCLQSYDGSKDPIRKLEFSNEGDDEAEPMQVIKSSNEEDDEEEQKNNLQNFSDDKEIYNNVSCCPCCGRIYLLNGSVLLQDEKAQRRALGAIAFHETTETFINVAWRSFLLSLIINGFVNYFLYPDERDRTTLLNILGISSLLNIICIEQVEFFKNNFCFGTNKDYNDILASSLDLPYIWPVVIGFPIVSGIARGIWQTVYHREKIEKLLKNDELYGILSKQGLWNNYFYWIFGVAIPELFSAIFPPFLFLKLLFITQTDVDYILEQTRDTILWDGTLSTDERKKLGNALVHASSYHIGLTRLKVLGMLADIVDGIGDKHLSSLKSVELSGPDNIIKTQKQIKEKAFNVLRKISNKVYENTPLPNYIYANYLLWRLGYPQENWMLQLLFYPYKFIKLYFFLMFFRTILSGLISILNEYLEKKKCLEAGNEWSYFEALNEFQCTVCADFNIFYRDIFTTKDCVRGYLDKNSRRSFDDMMNNIVNRDQQQNSWGINRAFNLSEVTSLILVQLNHEKNLFNPGELAVLLNGLKKNKMTNIQVLEIKFPWLANLTDIIAFGQFIQNSSVETMLCGLPRDDLEEEVIKRIANVLPQSKIKNLSLTFSFDTRISIIEALAKGLENSEVTYLELLSFYTNDDGIKIIAETLPRSKITWLKLDGSISSRKCEILAEQLKQSSVQILQLGGLEFDVDSLCIYALGKALINKTQDFHLEFRGDLHDDAIYALAAILPNLPLLKTLKFVPSLSGAPSSISAFIQALPKSQLVDLGMHFPDNSNFSVIIPRLAEAIHQSTITRFDFFIRQGFNDNELELLISFLPNKLQKITGLHLSGGSNRKLEPERVKAFFKTLPNTKIESFDINGFDVRNTLVVLAEVLPATMIKELELSDANITTNDISNLAKTLNQSKIERLNLYKNNIDDKSVGKLFEGLSGSPITFLSLSFNNLTDIGAKAIAQALTTYKFKHGLWIDKVDVDKKKSLVNALAYNPKTNLTALLLLLNRITDQGAMPLCDIVSQTKMKPYEGLFLQSNKINQSIIDNCGVLSSSETSSANSLRPTGPYFFLYRLYQGSYDVFLLLYIRYKPRKIEATHSQSEYKDDNHEVILHETPKQIKTMLDISQYTGSDSIIVDLNSHRLQNTIPISHDIIAVRGSIHRNNFLIGGDCTLLDVSQSRHINFLQVGQNNQLRLGFFSCDHVVVSEGQETIQIENFDSKDTLHLLSEHIIYPTDIENKLTICQNEILENDISAAVIQLKDTTVQLFNMYCEQIENNIRINNETAVHEAQMEVMNSDEATHSILYNSLLGICETFLNSVKKSALLTALPKFVTEMLYRVGGIPRHEAEASGREMQLIVTVSISDSNTAITASFLASWLTSRLTKSPQIISMASMGASIVTSVVETLWAQDASLSWIALQMGVAMVGVNLGNALVEKAENVVCELFSWGWNKANAMQHSAKNYFGFWQNEEKPQILHPKSPISSPNLSLGM